MEGVTGKNKFLPKFVNILEKLWKTEFSLNITNIVIFYLIPRIFQHKEYLKLEFFWMFTSRVF